MSAEYTPTTEDVTTAALAGGIYSEAEFDRWLAAHDAEVRAEALREAAKVSRAYSTDSRDIPSHVADVLAERADKAAAS